MPNIGRSTALVDLLLQGIEERMLEDENRIRLLERCQQHPPGVSHCGRCQYTDAGNVGVPALQTMGMLGRHLSPTAAGHAHHQRDVELAARHVAERRRVVYDLIEREKTEVDRHHLDYRPHTTERGADAGAHEGRFRERRIAYPLGPELIKQPMGYRERS